MDDDSPEAQAPDASAKAPIKIRIADDFKPPEPRKQARRPKKRGPGRPRSTKKPELRKKPKKAASNKTPFMPPDPEQLQVFEIWRTPREQPVYKTAATAVTKRVKATKRQFQLLPKPVRQVIVSAFVLLVLIMGAGFVYSWYSGQSGPVDNAQTKTANTTSAYRAFTPRKPRPDASVGESIEMLDSPVKPGGKTSIMVKTNALAVCRISVEYNNQNKTSSIPGLVTTKNADDYGTVSWDWTVAPGTPAGTWPVKVFCHNAKNRGQVFGSLVVK